MGHLTLDTRGWSDSMAPRPHHIASKQTSQAQSRDSLSSPETIDTKQVIDTLALCVWGWGSIAVGTSTKKDWAFEANLI